MHMYSLVARGWTLNTPKNRIIQKKSQRRISNSNLLINSKNTRNRSNWFRAEWWMWKSTVLKNTTDSFKKNISNMIYKHLRSTGTHEAVKGLSDLFSIRLQNDDILDSHVRWDQALLSARDMPSDVILEGLDKSKLQDSVQLQTVLASYDQETIRKNGQTSY